VTRHLAVVLGLPTKSGSLSQLNTVFPGHPEAGWQEIEMDRLVESARALQSVLAEYDQSEADLRSALDEFFSAIGDYTPYLYELPFQVETPEGEKVSGVINIAPADPGYFVPDECRRCPMVCESCSLEPYHYRVLGAEDILAALVAYLATRVGELGEKVARRNQLARALRSALASMKTANRP
jgi:hypothetical protein